MSKREISDLDLKIKLTTEHLNNGGIEGIPSVDLLKDLIKVKKGYDGKVDPDTVSPLVNAYMLALLGSHLKPPFFHPEHISEYRSTLQKSNNFDQINIDTKEDFDELYESLKNKENILFRGQREAKWRLYSTLQRYWISEELYKENYSYEDLIEAMVEIGNNDFGEKIKEVLEANHIDTVNSISILGFLQHHGCPTPLLDWTYSFKNALYFSIDNLEPRNSTFEIEEYCSVYHIEEEHFEGSNLSTIMENNLSYIEQPMLMDMIKEIANGDEEKRKEMEEHFKGRQLFDRKKINGSGLISHMTKINHLIDGLPIGYFSDKDKESGILFSLNNSLNINNQNGAFTWNSNSSKPIELVGDELYKKEKDEHDKYEYNFCSCININKNLEEHIRRRLDEDGITKDFIYPDTNLSTWEAFEKGIKKLK